MAKPQTNGKVVTEEDLRAPFVRGDAHGEYGQKPVRGLDLLVLILEAVLLLPLRALGAFTCLILYWLVCKLSAPLPRAQRAGVAVPVGKLACRACLFCIGFLHIKWERAPVDENAPRPGGIVSNHNSWADILLHMANSFPAFVARDSTKNLPLVGIIRCAPRGQSAPVACRADEQRRGAEWEAETGGQRRPRSPAAAEPKGPAAHLSGPSRSPHPAHPAPCHSPLQSDDELPVRR